MRETCRFTGDRLEIFEPFFTEIETRLLGPRATIEHRRNFRRDTQRTYTSRTLTQEILLEEKPPEQTQLFQALHERYVHNLKERVLEPFLKNENFRRAIKDFGSKDFRTYDQRIQNDVTFLMDNLRDRFGYSPKGAKEVCIYIIDNNLAHKYSPAL